ncbi:DUF348 domain-containing protein [Pedobacter sp.]|nr:DUF348 domain-containing protein [Candidatus Saccharibacteria bacterium]
MNNLIQNWTRLRVWAFCGLAFLLVFFLVAQRVSAAGEVPQPSVNERLVTIYDQGSEHTIITKATTVKEALTQANIILETADAVEPAVSEQLVAKSYRINVYRARPVLIIDGEKRQSIMTAEQSPRRIVESVVGQKLYDEDRASFERVDSVISEGGAGLKLRIDRATVFQFTLYGKTFEARTQATTVSDMLSEKKVTLGSQDGVSVPGTTPLVAGMNVSVWRNGKQTVTQEEAIAKPVEQVKDTARELGFKEVRTPGTDGKKQVTYEIDMRDGVEVSRAIVTSVTTLEPVKEVVVIGAKNNYSGSLNEWLLALRTCEAGGTYTRNSGNGFYGAYQFMTGTWDSIARRVRPELVGVRPDLASPADQDFMIITNTNMSSGGLASQNPGCYKKLGLSQFPPK